MVVQLGAEVGRDGSNCSSREAAILGDRFWAADSISYALAPVLDAIRALPVPRVGRPRCLTELMRSLSAEALDVEVAASDAQWRLASLRAERQQRRIAQ